MPKHKTIRTEEISPENWGALLKEAKALKTPNNGKCPAVPGWLAAVLAIDWLTGKRINEILRLKRRDILFTDGQIRIRFLVGKKRGKKAPLELQPYQKARTIKHKAVPWIREYLKDYDEKHETKEGYLFPANTAPRVRRVNTSWTDGEGQPQTGHYEYKDPGGYVYPENARYYLRLVNNGVKPEYRIYFHYGRHSIGIQQAYKGKTHIQIAAILDETPRAAEAYTKHAGGFAESWTNETE